MINTVKGFYRSAGDTASVTIDNGVFSAGTQTVFLIFDQRYDENSSTGRRQNDISSACKAGLAHFTCTLVMTQKKATVEFKYGTYYSASSVFIPESNITSSLITGSGDNVTPAKMTFDEDNVLHENCYLQCIYSLPDIFSLPDTSAGNYPCIMLDCIGIDTNLVGTDSKFSLSDISLGITLTTGFNVHYYSEGVKVHTESLLNPSSIPEYIPPSRAGYSFVGWSDGATTYTANALPCEKDRDTDVTYTAVWEEAGSNVYVGNTLVDVYLGTTLMDVYVGTTLI